MESGVGQKNRILAVDDSPTTRSVVILTFANNLEVHVRVEADPEAALEEVHRAIATSDAYTLFIFDIEMEPMDGFELASKVRHLPEHATTPIVFLSGHDDQETISRAAALGIRVIAKRNSADLRKNITALIRRPG